MESSYRETTADLLRGSGLPVKDRLQRVISLRANRTSCYGRGGAFNPVPGAERIMGRRLTAIGIALVFVGVTRALEAMDVEYAVGDCLVAAAVATLVTTIAPTQ